MVKKYCVISRQDKVKEHFAKQTKEKNVILRMGCSSKYIIFTNSKIEFSFLSITKLFHKRLNTQKHQNLRLIARG